MNPYIVDVLSQPSALRNALANYSPKNLDTIHARLQAHEFDRIILTGMGPSYLRPFPPSFNFASNLFPSN